MVKKLKTLLGYFRINNNRYINQKKNNIDINDIIIYECATFWYSQETNVQCSKI